MSAETFSRILGGRSLNYVGLGLIKVKEGADPERVAAELSATLPQDVKALTRDQIVTREKNYWVKTTSLGVIFSLGVLVAVFVGVVFLYQVMSSDIAYRLREYATLKAIGYHQRFLSGIVLRQAILFALFGYLPGLAIALVLYDVTRGMGNLPIGMTLDRVVLVLVAAMAMCCLSGLMALRKVRNADPADLF
jgi:putative ABC transport system permease protein